MIINTVNLFKNRYIKICYISMFLFTMVCVFTYGRLYERRFLNLAIRQYVHPSAQETLHRHSERIGLVIIFP